MDARDETCPLCGHPVQEIRQKLVCTQCHNICLTCCEGGEQEFDARSQEGYNQAKEGNDAQKPQ